MNWSGGDSFRGHIFFTRTSTEGGFFVCIISVDFLSAIRKDVKVPCPNELVRRGFLSWAHFFLPVLQLKAGFLFASIWNIVFESIIVWC
jgi:hypothetical protein